MRDVPIVKISLLILVIGLSIGGWRSWIAQQAGRDNQIYSVQQLELLTTADKANWIRAQVWSFNEDYYKRYHLTVHYMDSRAAMERVLAGVEQPVMWCPESPMWIQRANEVWRQQHHADLVPTDDLSAFRVFMKSPLVVLTTKEKAAYLRSFLGGPKPWASVRAMATGSQPVPWGKLRFSFADPLRSNSGMATLAMILSEYSRDSGADLTAATASDPKFQQYLDNFRKGYVDETGSTGGTAELAAAYLKNPNSMDFIMTYENVALSAARADKNLTVIYPNPTENAEQSVAVLSGTWVTGAQRDAAQAFLNYISKGLSVKAGLRYNMRPISPGAEGPLLSRLSAYRSQGFQQAYTSEDPPPYDALNIAAGQWYKHAGH